MPVDPTHRAKENPQSLEIDVLKKLKPLRKAHRVEETEGHPVLHRAQDFFRQPIIDNYLYKSAFIKGRNPSTKKQNQSQKQEGAIEERND